MLTQEMNVYLTRTGPGTPMGELLPALLDTGVARLELPQRDCPPVRVKLLGEKLVAFRDTEGGSASSTSSARIAGVSPGSVATRSAGCAARITGGSTT
jgi:hypothetical protein